MAKKQEEHQTALDHASSVLLLRLKNEGQGWTTLHAGHPYVADAADLARDEAKARGVADEEVQHLTPSAVFARAQELGASGADPHTMASETKLVRAEGHRKEGEPVAEAATSGPEASTADLLQPKDKSKR